MTPQKLRFTEFVELVLVRLYELDTGSPEFIDVNEIAAELREPVPGTWPYEAVKVLDDRGLVDAALAFASAHALITGEGRLFVEAREDVRSSTIHQYRTHPGNFVFVSGTGHQVVVGSEDVSQQATPNEPT